MSEATPAGTTIFDGEITAVEAEIERDQTLTIVRGYDQTHRLQRGTTTETHLDVTYGDIAGKIAGRHGLQQGDGGTSTVVHEAVVQWNADRLGVPVDAGRRDPATRSSSPTAPCTSASRATPASAPGEGDIGSDDARQLVAGANLLRLRATVSGAEQVEEVKVRGWDYKTKEAVEGAAQGHRRGAQRGGRRRARPTSPSKLGGGTLVKVDLPVDERRGRPGGRRLARRAARQRGDRARGRRPTATRTSGPACP